MHDTDHDEALPGDVVSIDRKYRGAVVACIDRQEYSSDHTREQWRDPKEGIMVDTDFGDLVHGRQSDDEAFVLVERVS